MVFGVQEGVGTPTIGEIVIFFRSELAFLEAQERNLVVRRTEIVSFLKTFGVGAASSSVGVQFLKVQVASAEVGGVSPSVPALAAGMDVASSSVPPPISSSVPAPAQPIVPAP